MSSARKDKTTIADFLELEGHGTRLAKSGELVERPETMTAGEATFLTGGIKPFRKTTPLVPAMRFLYLPPLENLWAVAGGGDGYAP